jgi:uncharacterized protein YbcI
MINMIKEGQRIVIHKCDIDKKQIIPVGERGYIIESIITSNYKILMDIKLDSGKRISIFNTDFRFEVYDKC